MWKLVWNDLCDAGSSLANAAHTAAAAVFGKRSPDGRVVSLGSWRWFPESPERDPYKMD